MNKKQKKSYGEHEYVIGFTNREMETRTKYVRPQYEIIRKLFSTYSLICGGKQALGTTI